MLAPKVEGAVARISSWQGGVLSKKDANAFIRAVSCNTFNISFLFIRCQKLILKYPKAVFCICTMLLT